MLVWVSAARLAPVMVAMETKTSSGTQIARRGHEPDNEDAQQHGPAGGFDGDRHESGNAGGRAFVGVRRPLMEGNGGDLEKQAGSRGEQRDDHDGSYGADARHAAVPAAADDRQIRAAGQAVEQAKVRRRRCRRKTRRAANTSARLRWSGGRGAGNPTST